MASMAFERLENPVNLVGAETIMASTSDCFWPGGDRCSCKPFLVSHTWKTCHENHRYRQPRATEQRKIVRAETPATTERYLVYPGKGSNCIKNSGSGSLRSGHRQQASSLRLNQAPRARPRPRRARIITSHGHAAGNAAACAVRDY